MQDFTNKIAVVTGGGTGMGRELVCQLIGAGAHVAMCDVAPENMAETQRLASALGTGRLTSHLCDVIVISLWPPYLLWNSRMTLAYMSMTYVYTSLISHRLAYFLDQ